MMAEQENAENFEWEMYLVPKNNFEGIFGYVKTTDI
jgi:hypothetical protein